MKGLGFSLIELVIGIAIMGLLAAMGVPMTRNWVLSHEVQDSKSITRLGLDHARAAALRNSAGLQDATEAAAIVCLTQSTLSLYQASSISSPAACGSGDVLWTARVSAAVTVGTATDALKCFAYTSRGLLIDPSDASGSDHCTTSGNLTIAEGGLSDTLTIN